MGAYDPEHGGGEVTAWACGIGSTVFTDDVIPDRCCGMDSISNTFCSDSVTCSKTDRRVAVRTDYDSRRAAKAALERFKLLNLKWDVLKSFLKR